MKLTVRIWKWMVGRRSFPFGIAYFQGRTVSFREGTRSYFQPLTQSFGKRAIFFNSAVDFWNGCLKLVLGPKTGIWIQYSGYVYIINFAYKIYTLPETNSSPLKIGHPKRKFVFQPSIFRCELLVSWRVIDFLQNKDHNFMWLSRSPNLHPFQYRSNWIILSRIGDRQNQNCWEPPAN